MVDAPTNERLQALAARRSAPPRHAARRSRAVAAIVSVGALVGLMAGFAAAAPAPKSRASSPRSLPTVPAPTTLVATTDRPRPTLARRADPVTTTSGAPPVRAATTVPPVRGGATPPTRATVPAGGPPPSTPGTVTAPASVPPTRAPSPTVPHTAPPTSAPPPTSPPTTIVTQPS